jgi:hypothetical protein
MLSGQIIVRRDIVVMHYEMMRWHVVMMKDQMMGQKGRRSVVMMHYDMMMVLMLLLMLRYVMLL